MTRCNIYTAHQTMLAKLAALRPPHIYVNPDPEEFGAVNEYLLDVARIVDECLLAVGREVKCNTPVRINMDLFTNVLRDALEGNACFEVERAIEDIRSERAA